MAKKLKDLTPKSRYQLRTASEELTIDYVANETSFGQNVGGVQMFSKSFKRGYGDKVFGSDDNGIWLGAADFADAPFRVTMEGYIFASSLDLTAYVSKTDTGQTITGDVAVGDGKVKIDGANKRIVINDGSYDRVLIGYDSGGF